MIKSEPLYDYINNNINLTSAISHYITLEKSHLLYRGFSPFESIHALKHLRICPQFNYWRCDKTHLGGDIASFVSRIEDVSPTQAARIVAARYDLDITALDK